MTVCANPGCGKTLEPNKGPGRARKWCSERCRRRTMYTGSCLDCGATTYGGDAIPPKRCVPCTAAHNKIWTRDALVGAIQTFAERYGRPPVAEDFNVAQARARGVTHRVERFYRDGDYPHYASVQREFGSFGEAIREAGFTPRPYGSHIGDYTPEQVAEMVALYGTGVSTLEVARRFRCSPTTVLYHLHKAGVARTRSEALRLRMAREAA